MIVAKKEDLGSTVVDEGVNTSQALLSNPTSFSANNV